MLTIFAVSFLLYMIHLPRFLRPRMHVFSRSATEGGILDYANSFRNIRMHLEEERDLASITLTHMVVLYFTLNGLALIVFLAECMLHKLRRDKV